jgi:hypothetical protein
MAALNLCAKTAMHRVHAEQNGELRSVVPFGHIESHKRNQLGLTLGFGFGALGELGVDLRGDVPCIAARGFRLGFEPAAGDQR